MKPNTLASRLAGNWAMAALYCTTASLNTRIACSFCTACSSQRTCHTDRPTGAAPGAPVPASTAGVSAVGWAGSASSFCKAVAQVARSTSRAAANAATASPCNGRARATASEALNCVTAPCSAASSCAPASASKLPRCTVCAAPNSPSKATSRTMCASKLPNDCTTAERRRIRRL